MLNSYVLLNIYPSPIYVTDANEVLYNYIIDNQLIYTITKKIYTIGVKVISLFIGK